jgi:hypothetical protein
MKKNTVKLNPINSAHSRLITEYKKNTLSEDAAGRTLLGLHIDNHMNWKQHVDQILQKLNAACSVIGILFATLNLVTLRNVFFAYFQSIITYGINGGGGEDSTNAC